MSKRQTSQSKKWAEDLNRPFSKKDIQLAKNKNKTKQTKKKKNEKMLNIANREMQMKTTMR